MRDATFFADRLTEGFYYRHILIFMNRIPFIFGFIGAISLLFVGVYFFAFRNDINNPTVDEQKLAQSKEEADRQFSQSTTEEAVSAVTEVSSYGAAILDDTHIAYFNNRSLKRSPFSGGAEETIVADLPGKIIDAAWAPDREKVLVLLETEAGRRWHLISVTDRSITALKIGISSPVWSNLSERIFYSFTNPSNGEAEIDSAKPDGSDWKLVTRLEQPASFMSTIPSTAILSFWSKPSAFEETSLYTVAASGGTPKRIFFGKYGADYLWSPDGMNVLISNTLSKGGTETRLGTANQNGGEFRTLQAPTLVSKAVWAKDAKTVYYALPLSLPENAVLPNDYFSRPIHTQDSFWKMDVTTGKNERIISADKILEKYDSSELFLDENEEHLFFTDRTSGKVFRITLGQ
jgi:hypothetical protein